MDVLSGILLFGFTGSFVALAFLFWRKTSRTRKQEIREAVAKVQAEFGEGIGKTEHAPHSQGATLQNALRATRGGFWEQLRGRISRTDDLNALIAQIEPVLFAADLGVHTAQKLVNALSAAAKSQPLDEASAKVVLEGVCRDIFAKAPNRALVINGKPTVIMFVGVNGVGKTTSIGKMAHMLHAQGKRVLLGAGDTFRAAAAEQLAVWGERTSSLVVRGKEAADPASVLFDAVKEAREQNADVVLCDTAGRLHTKKDLIDELSKVHRVLSKAADGAPHEILLVIDATQGQNAIMQAKEFAAAVPLTGVVLTKLDGTAKGGVVVGMVDQVGVPVRFVGLGEGVDDLRVFDADAFVHALFSDEQPAEVAVAQQVAVV